MQLRRIGSVLIAGLLAVPLMAEPSGASGTTGPSAATSSSGGPMVSPAVQSDTSPALRDIKPVAPPKTVQTHDHRALPVPPSGATSDPVIQSSAPAPATATAGTNFLGVGVGFTGPAGSFSVNSAPPDTNGAVGATQFVEIVNESFAVFNKSDHSVALGPVATNTLFSKFGGGCQTNDDGDGTVKYDQLANRWIITQFSVSTTPYLQCVAVSTTSDATGTWNRYAFSQSSFPDYPKLGVWPDGYYQTFNRFNGNTFVGAEVCAYDRATMLAGAAATQQCFNLSSSYGGLLPSDLDGSILPPAGAPNYLLNFGTNSLNLWKFHVDFSTSANSTLTGPTSTAVAAFTPPCGGSGGTCIPQSGTRQQLDTLGDRLMYRLAYRHFSDGHESLIVTHSVTAGSSVGVRWYELRNLTGTLLVYQQGTFAPDSNYRWMGSAAMDQVGDIAMGYSVSSSTMYPAIRYTGRVPGDPLGTMEAETVMTVGGGSQLRTLNRWGDYTSMAVDPTDDCTFWYSNEYLQSSGTFNWSTRIGTFKFPKCSTPPAAPTNLTATAVAPTQIDLSWTASFGATSYEVERSTDGVTGWTQIATPSVATYNDTGLAVGAAYFYRVRATNGSGDSNYSSAASAVTLSGNWVGTYGSAGYAVGAWGGATDLSYFAGAAVSLDQGSRAVWTNSTSDLRALESPDTTTREATAWYDPSQVRLHLSLTGAFSGTLHLYAVDWDSTARRQTVTVDDGSGPQTASLASTFNSGAWLAFPISTAGPGTVTITVSRLAGANAVLSGIFLN